MNPDEMTPEQINAAIAQMCGWKLIPEGSKNPPPISFRLCPICNYVGSRHEGRLGMAEECDHESDWVAAADQWTLDGIQCVDYPPDYHSSLDAMATAEATLTDEERKTYAREIYDKAECNGLIDYEDRVAFIDWASAYVVASATASQRARAFLRVKGKLP